MAESPDRANLSRWLELARKERKGAEPDDLVWQTPEGLEVKPLYTRADVTALDFLDSVPGDFPFVRGPRRKGKSPGTESRKSSAATSARA